MNRDTFLKKLLELRPTILQQYSYEFLPETFKGNDLLTVHCIAHGLFKQKAYSHLYGKGCTLCANERTAKSLTLSTNDFIEKSKAKYGERFSYEKTHCIGAGKDLLITCPDHGDFSIRPKAHMWLPYGCPNCSVELPRLNRKQKLLNKAKIVHGDKYDYSKVNYAKFNDMVEIICPKHGSFWQFFHVHVNKPTNCPTCIREADKLTIEEFISKSEKIHGKSYDYSKVVYETNRSMVTINCPKHGDFVQRAASHLSGNKCRDCYVEDSRNSKEEFVKKAKQIHSDKYDYSKAVYKGSKIPLEIICPKHGSFWQRPNTHTSSKNGCCRCSESKGENEVERCLLKYNIKHFREYRILPHRYRYDFFLPELNIYIEFNGQQHYKPVEMFGGLPAFLKVKENDKIKRFLVKQHQGKLIVLTYLTLAEQDVERVLIASLKRIYPYWFVINGKLQVYKNALDVCNSFKLPETTILRDVVKVLKNTISDFRVLF